MRRTPRSANEGGRQATTLCASAIVKFLSRPGFTQTRPPLSRGSEIALPFYPGKMDARFANNERVQAQFGDFYGSWITRDIVGPFKGDLETMGW